MERELERERESERERELERERENEMGGGSLDPPPPQTKNGEGLQPRDPPPPLHSLPAVTHGLVGFGAVLTTSDVVSAGSLFAGTATTPLILSLALGPIV